MISYDDFLKVEMEAGTVVSVEDFPEARNPAYKLKIDFGGERILSSSAQITAYYKKEDLLGKQVVAVTNFPPKRIAGFKSECLVLGFQISPTGVVLIQPERPVPLGTRLF